MTEYIERGKVQEAMKPVTDDITCPLHIAAEIDQVLSLSPAADVRPERYGRWEPLSDDDQDEGVYLCSECNSRVFFDDESLLFDYCPKCGAKMDGKDGESDERKQRSLAWKNNA